MVWFGMVAKMEGLKSPLTPSWRMAPCCTSPTNRLGVMVRPSAFDGMVVSASETPDPGMPSVIEHVARNPVTPDDRTSTLLEEKTLIAAIGVAPIHPVADAELANPRVADPMTPSSCAQKIVPEAASTPTLSGAFTVGLDPRTIFVAPGEPT